jgi:hypothetical protein
MRINPTYVAPLLAAGAAALATFAAPAAAAFPKICTANGGTCQSPGNVEINNSPPAVSFYPYGTVPWLLGGN